MPDLLVVAEVDVRRVRQLRAPTTKVPDGRQQDGHAELVVQEAGLDEPRLRHHAPRLKGNDVPRVNPQSLRGLLRTRHHVQADLDVLLRAGLVALVDGRRVPRRPIRRRSVPRR